MINEVCGGENNPVLNVGGKLQCLEAPVKTFALARETFSFASVAASKTSAAWRTAIENKDVVIFPYVEAITANNTDAVIKNGRYRDYTLKAAVPGSNYRMDLAICTHEAVKSYETSEYTRIFRISAEDEFTCDVQTGGAVKGEAISNFIVGIRNEATDDDVANTIVGIKYRKEGHDILVAGFDLSEVEGVHDVTFIQESASATLIEFKAQSGCSGALIKNLATADVKLYESNGTPKTATFVAADADGVYSFTGTGFANGMYISTDGVRDLTDIFYESPEPLVIAVT
jgi:hypothetical protein